MAACVEPYRGVRPEDQERAHWVDDRVPRLIASRGRNSNCSTSVRPMSRPEAAMHFAALFLLANLTQGSFVIRDVRVFDGARTLQHRSVLVDSGRIKRIGDAGLQAPGAAVIDGRGRTLLPGFIDAHVHIP